MTIENFNVALELLRKAETLTEEGDKYRAVTYNNFACIFRRTKKLRSALSYLEKALEIEYNYLHYSDDSVDDCLQVLNPTDIHLNICAILSQMGKHELALQHSMKALILIQDELITKIMAQEVAGERDPNSAQEIKKPEDRLTVLCIAYHNIAVEQEFLKQYQASLNSYAKAAQSAHKYLGADHPMTQNMNEVLNQATKKIANIIQKSMSRQKVGQKGGISTENLETLIRD
jgi:tetratricopeptide (TPR) repeat protein